MPKMLFLPILASLTLATPVFAQQQQQPIVQPKPPKPQPSVEFRYPNQWRDNFQRDYTSKYLLGARIDRSPFLQADLIAQCLELGNSHAGSLVGGVMTVDPRYRQLVRALRGPLRQCSIDGPGVPLALINGALAERLVERAEPALDDRARAVNMTSAEPFYVAAHGRTMGTVGRCLAVYSPGLAYKVLATQPSSNQEDAALVTLYGRTPECGLAKMPAGIPLGEQRSAIAAGLYQWLNRG